MPVDNSRIPGFNRLSVSERRQMILDISDLETEDIDSWAKTGELGEDIASHMIENVVGTMSLPVGIATNFIIDGKHYLIPFAVEEASIVAAASNMAKRCIQTGGFITNCDDSIMIGQIQLLEVPDIEGAIRAIEERKESLISLCNSLPSTIVKLGGGCKDIVCRKIETSNVIVLIVHLQVDCLDAMGANAVNTMTEFISPEIEVITGGTVNLRILSNLAVHRMARVEAVWKPEDLVTGNNSDGSEIINEIIEAYNFACYDPFRATTHNKGIMNAISAISLACGQDWRAIEAGCHAWAAFGNTSYSSLTKWEIDSEGNLVGSLECPIAVGIVGGASRVHPAAKTNLKLLGANSAKELAGILVSAGLAQNLGALRALATTGIQRGHMKLHAENMAISAGAKGDEISKVAEIIRNSDDRITQSSVEETLSKIREQGI